MMAKRCAIQGCGKRLHKNAVDNPQSLDLCREHYVAQGHVQTSKVKCMIIGCVGRAEVTGLCKKHTYQPASLFGLNVVEKKYSDGTEVSTKKGTSVEPARRSLIAYLLSWSLDITKMEANKMWESGHLGDIQPQHMQCYYCKESTVSSLGQSPAHACFTCWSQINKR